jgi:hypothetical protein
MPLILNPGASAGCARVLVAPSVITVLRIAGRTGCVTRITPKEMATSPAPTAAGMRYRRNGKSVSLSSLSFSLRWKPAGTSTGRSDRSD